MGTILKIIGNEQVLNLIATVLAALGSYLVAKYIKKFIKDEKEQTAWNAIEVAIEKVWKSMREQFEKAAADGKISEDEKAKLRAAAKTLAKDELAKVGMNLYKVFGDDVLNLIIGKIVDKRHIRKNLSNGVV